jgi:hypothetical protein
LFFQAILDCHLHIGHNGLLGEENVGSTISELVPAVGGTDENTLGDLVHNMTDVGVELGSGQVTTVKGLGTDSDGVNDVLVTGDCLLDGGPIAREGRLGKEVLGVGGLANPIQQKSIMSVEFQLRNRYRHLPHAQNDLEALVLSSRQDVLRSVTLGTGVGADESRQALQGVEIGLIVTGGLASAVGILVTERETQSTLRGNEGRGCGQQEGNKTGGTHGR